MVEVRIDVVDMHDQTRAGSVLASWRVHLVLGTHAMQPHVRAARPNLAMQRPSLRVAVDETGRKLKDLDEKLVLGLNIFADQERNNATECWHVGVPFSTR